MGEMSIESLASRVGIDSGIMSLGDLTALERQIGEMRKRKEALQKHDHELFQSGGYWMTYVIDDGKRKRIKRKDKKDLEDAIIALYGGTVKAKKKKTPTVKECFEAWNDQRLEKGFVIGSTHLRDTKFFNQFYRGTDFEGRCVGDITASEWTAFLQEKLNSMLTAKAWAGLRGITRGTVDFCFDAGYIRYASADVISAVRVHRRMFKAKPKDEEDEIYYADELQALRAACLRDWDSYTSCIWLISITGLRIGEASALCPADIDIDRMVVQVRKTETHGDETGQQVFSVRADAKTEAGIRSVSVALSHKERLKKIKERAESAGWEYIFCRDDGERLQGRAVRKRLKKICEENNIQYRPPHKLRKTAASILLESGKMDERTIIKQLGHTDIKTTHDFYQRSRMRDLERAKALDEIAEMSGTAMVP